MYPHLVVVKNVMDLTALVRIFVVRKQKKVLGSTTQTITKIRSVKGCFSRLMVCGIPFQNSI